MLSAKYYTPTLDESTMAFVLADRVKETTTTTGTGPITLGGAAPQFQTFSSGIGANNTTFYALIDGNGTGWEVGLGTVDSLGTTLMRTTIFSSSNSNLVISLSANTHSIFCDLPASIAASVSSSYYKSFSASQG
jgi:hypothetical protein